MELRQSELELSLALPLAGEIESPVIFYSGIRVSEIKKARKVIFYVSMGMKGAGPISMNPRTTKQEPAKAMYFG